MRSIRTFGETLFLNSPGLCDEWYVPKLVSSRVLFDSVAAHERLNLSEMSVQSKAFDLVKLIDLDPKPRDKGVIEIRGSYYASVSYGFLKDLLDVFLTSDR